MEVNMLRRLRRAAESGEAAAQFNLGVLYDSRVDDNGYAIKGNRAEAIKWLRAAAAQGLSRAQWRVAELYASGPNASENLVDACAWLLLATKTSRGVHRQRARTGYEHIAGRLKPEELAAAKRLAGHWKAQTGGGRRRPAGKSDTRAADRRHESRVDPILARSWRSRPSQSSNRCAL